LLPHLASTGYFLTEVSLSLSLSLSHTHTRARACAHNLLMFPLLLCAALDLSSPSCNSEWLVGGLHGTT
jgi:hypothetical protein